VAQAAARELMEECGALVPPEQLRPVAKITFVFPAQPDWDQTVHVFLVTSWQGQLAETREMRPAWFPRDGLPFDQMWQDNRLWLPDVLAGHTVVARYTFANDNATVQLVERSEHGGDFHGTPSLPTG